MSLNAVLGQIGGIDITVADMIEWLSALDPDTVLGQRDGVTLTAGEELRQARRVALLPRVVPESERVSDWAEAVLVRGEAPYGRCVFCNNALSAGGCLNLCDMPSGSARTFNEGLQAVIRDNRAEIAWLEALGGCTCGPPRLSGYEIERSYHARGCPMVRD